jgi:uncharacterized protein (DUF1330 family)
MAAYLIANLDVRDPAAYEKYKAEVPALIRKHGGEYIVRGGKHEVLEGAWQPTRLVLFKFPDAASIRRFIADPEYQPLKALRREVAATDLVMVEGL